jgi:uncharacterized DUF497 family protein
MSPDSFVTYLPDRSGATANLRAHRVSFAEAVTVLEDDLALTREDPAAGDEPRFVTPGLSNLGGTSTGVSLRFGRASTA